LETAQVDVADAKALALALFKSLEDPVEPVDTDDAYDVDPPHEDLSAARYHLRGRTSKFFGRVA
jgi:hypothetical protein